MLKIYVTNLLQYSKRDIYYIIITNCVSLRSHGTTLDIKFASRIRQRLQFKLFTAVEEGTLLRYSAFGERGFYGQQMTFINLRSSRRKRENRVLRTSCR